MNNAAPSRRMLLVGAVALFAAGCGADAGSRLPSPSVRASGPAGPGLEKAVLAGGCFWGVQAVFAHVKGVESSISGYAGGTAEQATYEQVTSGRTGHAEAVEVTFDPSTISYGEILQIFFTVATDPTQLNMQHPDIGPQYRNEIFYTTEDQKRIAEGYIAELDAAGAFAKPIVTKVSPLPAFYPAEDYHQDYLFKHPNDLYIVTYDQPKLRDLKAKFPERWAEEPVMVASL